MTRHPGAKKRSEHSIPNFEMRSVLLFAVLTMGAAGATQAQTASAAPAATQHGATAQVALSAPAGVASANKGGGAGVQAAFKRADRDGDGTLSRHEIEHFPALAQRFEQIDSNRDSFISRGEFNQAAGL